MYDEIIELLKSKKGKYRQIADGANLSYDWLLLVARGKIDDPGIKKMQELHEFLLSMDDDPKAA